MKLRDGRSVDVRPLERCDRALLEAAFAVLRRAGFSGRGGAGTLREYELALCA
jgi:hypothetical protein